MVGCTATGCWRPRVTMPSVMAVVGWVGAAGRAKLQDNLSNQSFDLQASVQTKGNHRVLNP